MKDNLANPERNCNVCDTVTVLKVASRKSATKTFQWDGFAFIKTHGYGAGKWFDHEELTVSNIQDLSQILTAVEASQDRFIIRGELNIDAPSNEVMARIVMELGARGTMKVTTMPAMPIDQFVEMLSSSSSEAGDSD